MTTSAGRPAASGSVNESARADATAKREAPTKARQVRSFTAGVLQQEQRRALDELAQFREVLRADGAIDHAMIGAQADRHALPNDDLLLVIDHGLLHDRADADDQSLWRVDDRAERLDAVTAEIRDGDRAARVFFGF